MISRTGNKRGLSFVEVMVTVAILASGLLLIYKAFFISMEYVRHVNCRLEAVTRLDNKIEELERLVREKKHIPFVRKEELEAVTINNQGIVFKYALAFTIVKDVPDLYRLDLSLSWQEGRRPINLSRSVFIAGPKIN